MFPPLKKIHMNIGYQMDSLNAATGSPRSVRRRTSRLRRKSIKRNNVPSLSSSSFSGSGPPPPPLMNDHKALTAYIMDQMAMMQLSQQQQSTTGSLETSSGTTCPSLAKLYTSYLPNFMWYQPTAADSSPSSMIRPTSLCSGTGITGDHQYLQPDMLNMFRMFGSYFVGSGHLFQDDDDDDDVRENKNVKNKRRSAFWVETIDEKDVENDSTVSEESTNSSYDESTTGSDYSDTCQIQKELIEKVIEDLRCSSQMMIMDPRILTDYKIRDK
mmetsp:Transcript_5848/g.10281  ORF Transcript_5848/g.10281 Transcript_5848/m.10281 type:complete len:271 (-) Transcript_5848:26-838(-)